MTIDDDDDEDGRFIFTVTGQPVPVDTPQISWSTGKLAKPEQPMGSIKRTGT